MSTDKKFLEVEEAATWLNKACGAVDLAIVLGSGLGAFGDELKDATRIPYQDIPFAPVPHVTGHAGQLIVGSLGGKRIAALSGRVHAYEGLELERVTFLGRAIARAGVKRFVLTNAAGSVNVDFRPGDLMVLRDHLNLSTKNPLIGPNRDEWGPRFLDMTSTYDKAFAELIFATAKEQGVSLREGVYAGLMGPTYETPAEIRMLRVLGADAVGMSTVSEAIALRHMGVRLAGISCITNLGAGMGHASLSHQEVKETADRVASTFVKLLSAALPKLAAA